MLTASSEEGTDFLQKMGYPSMTLIASGGEAPGLGSVEVTLHCHYSLIQNGNFF